VCHVGHSTLYTNDILTIKSVLVLILCKLFIFDMLGFANLLWYAFLCHILLWHFWAVAVIFLIMMTVNVGEGSVV